MFLAYVSFLRHLALLLLFGGFSARPFPFPFSCLGGFPLYVVWACELVGAFLPRVAQEDGQI